MIRSGLFFGVLDFHHDAFDLVGTVKRQALVASRCDVVTALYISD